MIIRNRTRDVVVVIVAAIAAAAAVAGLAACVGPVNEFGAEEVGRVQLALTQVPNDARCIRLTSDSSGRRVTQQVSLTPGAASFTTTFGGLPIGATLVWADIFNATCSTVTAATVATWVSDPVVTTTTAGGTTNLSLIVRRPGNTSVSVDFCTTNPCVTCASGFHSCGGVCMSNTSITSCGSSCSTCPAPPGNGAATCNGTSCGVICNSGFHSCGAGTCSPIGPTSCGTACADCTRPNQLSVCSSLGVCINSCRDSVLSPNCLAGGVSCGTWEFESAPTQTEGWSIDLTTFPDEPHGSTGPLTISTAWAGLGRGTGPGGASHSSLAIPYDGRHAPPFQAAVVRLVVPLCSGGQSVALGGKTFHADITFGTPGETPGPAFLDGSVQYGTGSGTSFFDFTNVSQNVVHSIDGTFFGAATSSTLIIYFSVLDSPGIDRWVGNVYIDNIQIR